MPAKRNENNDVSGYRNLGKHHWKEFVSATGKFDPGKANFKPRLEMLSPKGMTKTFYDHKAETRIDVHYDEEFVYDYYYQRLVLTMGWMDNGVLEENLLQLFFAKLCEYCNTVNNRTQNEKVKKQAQELAKQFPERSVEEWEEFLLNKITPVSQQTKSEETEIDDDIVITEDGISEEDVMDYYDADIEADGSEMPISLPDKLYDDLQELENMAKEDALNIESTTEDTTPIVPPISTKKRGRPPKSTSKD